MCWRDDLSNDEWLADFRRIQAGHLLVQAPAQVGDKVYIDLEIGKVNRRYFRRKTVHFLSGPLDTTEVLFRPETRVVFHEMPVQLKGQLNLIEKTPSAKIVVEDGKIGFAFGRDGTKRYFPLTTEDRVLFEVRSLP